VYHTPVNIARRSVTSAASSAFARWANLGTLVMVSPRGAVGSSPAAAAEDLSIRCLADDLDLIRQRLGYRHWVFGRTAAGGHVGLRYAVKYGQWLQGLILVSTAPSGRFRHDLECIYNPARSDYAAILAKRIRAPAADAIPDELRAWAAYMCHTSAGIERQVATAVANASRSDIETTLDKRRLLAMRSELEGTDGYAAYDVTDQLGQIRTPTLIIGGRHDVSNPVRWSQVLHEGIPDSELVVIEDGGHILWADDPEHFQEAVELFAGRFTQ
jgi:proline iminopeptidase